jgi:cell shape-determining protein MreD
MSRSVVFVAIAILLPMGHFFLQVGLGIGRWAPDLLAIALLLLAREARAGLAAGIGFFLGLLEDAFSILSFGANTVTLTLLGVLGARSRDLFVGESVPFFVVYLAIGTWLRHAIHWVIAGEGVRGSAADVLLVEAPVASLYAAAVGVLLLMVTGVIREGRG